MLKTCLLIPVLFLTPLTASASNSDPVDSVDRITAHYRTIWEGIMVHISNGNLWVYYDTESNHRVLQEDIMYPENPRGFAATFNHTITGRRSEIALSWLGTKVFSNLYYMDVLVYMKYEDLYPLLSPQERADLETMSFLFRNTTMHSKNQPCNQGCTTALYNNMAETEHAYFNLQSYGLLLPLVSHQITKTLVDSTRGPKTYLDKRFRKPLDLWKAAKKEVHQIPDKKFPGEFKDSVVIKAYGTIDSQLHFNGGTLRIDFHTGESLYCRTEDFLQALPGWCAHFVPIIYNL